LDRSGAGRTRARRWLLAALALLLCVSLPGCEGAAGDGGQLVLWHGWAEREVGALTELLGRFAAIHPDVKIIPIRVPPEQLYERFRMRASMGLGPDLLIIPSQWERDLAEAGLIQDLSDRELDTSLYLSGAVETLRYEGRLYGLPMSLRTVALYYNRELTTEPPTTLTGLLSQAAQGRQVLLYSDFYHAFWGIRAFGGQLFDDEGRVVLHRLRNYTKEDPRVRSSIKVTVQGAVDPRELARLLVAAVAQHGSVRSAPTPQVLFSAFGENRATAEVQFWLDSALLIAQVTSELYLIIRDALLERGLTLL